MDGLLQIKFVLNVLSKAEPSFHPGCSPVWVNQRVDIVFLGKRKRLQGVKEQWPLSDASSQKGRKWTVSNRKHQLAGASAPALNCSFPIPKGNYQRVSILFASPLCWWHPHSGNSDLALDYETYVNVYTLFDGKTFNWGIGIKVKGQEV